MDALVARLNAALAGRYTLERELGRGGMATVYLAEDPRHRRKVALKVLRPDLAATLGPERFLREVTIAANLQHPHILPVYDSGDAEGFLYYVMPYVEGESLRDRLAKHGELPLTDAVRILRDVADAMAAAHAKGVVHRDIKPENIMLSGRHALVADFGVAKAVSEATGRETLTTAGVALGTPTYMAPEQAAADPHTDHRADLYSFGATAYEMLTGRPPFMGATPQAVLAAHVTESPVMVTQRRAAIPAPLAQLVMRCLAKKAADRPQSAEELLPVLEALATPSGGITPTQTQPVQAVRSGVRKRWPLAAGAVTMGVLAVFGLQQFGRDDSGVVAVFPFGTRSPDSADAWLAEGLAEQIGSHLARRPQLRVLSTNAVAAQRQRTPDPLEAGRALKVRWVVTGALRRVNTEIQARVEVALAGSGVQAWSSSFRRDDGDFARLEREVAESVAAALIGKTATRGARQLALHTAADPEAYRLFLIGQALLKRRTQETAMQAVASYEEAVRRDPRFAAAWAALAQARVIQYSWSGWEVNVPRDSLPAIARRAATTALALDPRHAVAASTMGQLAAWVDADYNAARQAFEQALQLDSMDATIWHAYGAALGVEGANDLPVSERLLRRSLTIDPDQPNTWRHLALSVAGQGRFNEAEAILDTLVALGPWERAHGDRSYVRFLRGDGAGALADLRTLSELTGVTDSFALALYTITTGNRDPALAWLGHQDSAFSMSVAMMNAALGRTESALDVLERLAPTARTWAALHDPIFAPLRKEARFTRLLEDTRPRGAR